MICTLSLAIRCYSLEPRTRKYVKDYGFLSFGKKYGKQLLHTASKKVIHNAVEATSAFLGNKIAVVRR